jgi:predicted Zn-dependent protease
MIAATVVGAVATLVAGDTSGLMAGLPATLANLSYTRDMEREADRYAIEQLRRRSIPLAPFATLLERLQQSRGPSAPSAPAYLSTHPDTEERIRAIRAADVRG